jgi:hypothetical protein
MFGNPIREETHAPQEIPVSSVWPVADHIAVARLQRGCIATFISLTHLRAYSRADDIQASDCFGNTYAATAN